MFIPSFEMEGRVEAVLVSPPNATVSKEVPEISAVQGYGIRDDSHANVRYLDARERDLLAFGFSKGVEIANFREFSAVSAEDLVYIAQTMQLPGSIPYGCLGENLVISGIPRLSKLPSGTKLFFRAQRRGCSQSAVLVVWEENTPCKYPGEAIQGKFPDTPDLARRFVTSAVGKRGIVGSVYLSGTIREGDTVVVKVPDQQVYLPY